MKQILFSLLFVGPFTISGLSQVTTHIMATGQSSGQVASATVQNLGSQIQAITLPSGIIPGRRANQGFFVPDAVPVRVPAGQTVTVPITGYCTDFSLPTPEPGTLLPPPTEWDTDNPIIHQIADILQTLKDRSDAPSTPFPIEPDFMTQEIVWVITSPGDQSLNNLCDRIREGYTSQTGSQLSSDEQQHLDYATSEILGLVCRTLREHCPLPPSVISEIPGVIAAESKGTSKPPPGPVGTGRTTGHVCTIEVANPTDRPATIHIGPLGSPIYIPATGKHQAYVIPSIPPVRVPAGATVQVPVTGYCTDIHRPPVPDGVAMPPVSDWISPAGGLVPEGDDVWYFPTSTAPPMGLVAEAVNNASVSTPCLPAACFSPQTKCPKVLPAGLPLLPGTNGQPMPFTINEQFYPGVSVPVLLEAIGEITRAFEVLQPQGVIRTPFSNRPEQEREAVIQQTFWRYAASVSGNAYTLHDFRQQTTEQFENNMGRKLEESPKELQKQVEQGVQDFWNSFQATGVEAKILPPSLPAPAIQVPGVDEYFERKPKPDPSKWRSQPEATSSTPLSVPEADGSTQPELISSRNFPSNCACDKLKASLEIFNTVPNENGGWRTDGPAHFRNQIDSPADGESLELDARNDGMNGSRQMLILRNIQPSCNCLTEYNSSQLRSARSAAERELRNAERNIGRDTTRAIEEVGRAQDQVNRAQEAVNTAQTRLDEARPHERARRQRALEDAQETLEEKKKILQEKQEALEQARNQVAEARRKLEELQSAEPGVPSINSDACPSAKPVVTAKANGRAIQLNNEWFGGEGDPQHPGHNFRLSLEPGQELEIELTVTFTCADPDCGSAATCSKIIKVIVHKP
jgi:hypothetical protein